MPELTPRDDVKKAVSEILKRIDQLLKAGDVEQAISQIEKAKELDPKNVYVFAYEERIVAMQKEKKQADEIAEKRKVEEEKRQKEEDDKKKAEEEKRRIEEEKRRAEEDRRRKIEEEKKRKEEEQRRIEEEKQRKKEEEERKALEARRKVEDERRQAEEARKKDDEVRRKIDSERKKWSSVGRKEEVEEPQREERRPQPEPLQPKAETAVAPGVPEISQDVLEETKRKILEDRRKKGISSRAEETRSKAYRHAYDEGLDIYRRALFEAWADGATNTEEKEQLESLRSSLMILPEDHERLEKEAKIGAYTTAFRRAWSSGAISPESASALAELRKKFKINLEEHEEIETQLLWELRSSSQKARLLIIDDDSKLLKVISDTLQDAGYQTVAVTTTDEAFEFLKDATPDLIISDINLETSTMGGFTFYEKVREMERLAEIPFIFLSGLTDEVLIRTGKELGVDDYLTKPFSDETLLATIKGKLKRYRQLRKSRQKK